MPVPTVRLAILASLSLLTAAAPASGNTPPNTPTITEPSSPGQVLNPYDAHMETTPFSDADVGDEHLCSDWEIWTVNPSQRIWIAACVKGPEKVHAHLGDGTFENSHTGWTSLFPFTNYSLRVRHRDDSGDTPTEWSNWTSRPFSTGAGATHYPMFLDDVDPGNPPTWELTSNGSDVDLPTASPNPSLRIESATGQLLLRIDASSNPGNNLTNPPALATHQPIRVVVQAGSSALSIGESDLTVDEHHCEFHTILLPAINLAPFSTRWLWVNADGATYEGIPASSTPDFSTPARGLTPPWVARQPGFVVEIVAEGLHLPVNVAMAPTAGGAPGSPLLYVTELYGSIKTVLNDGTVLTYASGLLDYTPSGNFPGSGEQGVAGITVDPGTGDVYATMLRFGTSFGGNYPKVVRFTSIDGGLTAFSQSTILDMPGESQGQSHQISRIEFMADGTLHVHMGDGFSSSTAQNLQSFRGKILRLNTNGTAPTDNPFYNAGDGISATDYVWVYGVRNPFGGGWRASDDSRYCVENGPSIDRLTKLVKGQNYLWNGSDSSMLNFAKHSWNPAVGPVNICFVQPETFGGSGFPAAMHDHAFVSESGPTYAPGPQTRGKRITEFEFDANGNVLSGPTPLVEYVGDGRATVVGLAAGPDGLYFTELYKDLNTSGPTASGARLLRVRFVGTDDCNGNGTPDVCDIEDGHSTDFDGNGLPDECDPLSADKATLSLSAGGSVAFTLEAGVELASKRYFLVGTSSGTQPGTLVNGLSLPLNIAGDPWFLYTLSAANTSILTGTLGILDGQGSASSSLNLPPQSIPSAAGMTFHHAYAVIELSGGVQVVGVSNAVPLDLLP